MTSAFLLMNGQFYPANEKLFSINLLDRVFMSERLRTVRNQIPFWNQQLDLVELKLKITNTPLPSFLENRGKELKRQIERLLAKNKLFRSAIIHLHLLKDSPEIAYLLVAEPLDMTSYELNTNGLRVSVFDKLTKSFSPLSALDTGSLPYWKLATTYASVQQRDELLLINEQQSILEAPYKSIYLIKDKQIITPAPESGAYMDISRDTIDKACQRFNFTLKVVTKLTEPELLQADEFFLANAVQGIEWVKAFRQKRYFNKKTKLILQEFNRLLLTA